MREPRARRVWALTSLADVVLVCEGVRERDKLLVAIGDQLAQYFLPLLDQIVEKAQGQAQGPRRGRFEATDRGASGAGEEDGRGNAAPGGRRETHGG